MKIFEKIVLALLLPALIASFEIYMQQKEYADFLRSGDMRGFFTYDQFWRIMEEIRSVDANAMFLSERVKIGRTYEGNDLYGFYLTDDTKNLEHNLSHKSIAMLTSLTHSREPLTLTMVVLMVIEVLKLARVKNHNRMHEFFRDNVIFFVPVVNTDSYIYINKHFNDGNSAGVRMIRKNRNIDSRCNEITGGVDLNRNWDFKFGMNDQGSSSDPCQEDYRGTAPFSELETAALKNYVDNHRNIVSAVNIHTYGNVWIYPFNFVNDKTDHFLQVKRKLFYDFYNDFQKEISQKHIKCLFGNAAFTLDYPTNGEAGDWFTGKKNILNLDVELGNLDPRSEQFYPPRAILADIVQYNWIVMKKFIYHHVVELSHRIVFYKRSIAFEIMNIGLGALIDFEGVLELKWNEKAPKTNAQLSFCTKKLPTDIKTKVSVLENEFTTTLKGRHMLEIVVTFDKPAHMRRLKGLKMTVKRNTEYKRYPNQEYMFKVSK